jgi:hypothetical protein
MENDHETPSMAEAQLAPTAVRPNRTPRNVAWVLAQLQGGRVLYSGRKGDQRWWMLDDGRSITGNTARRVIADPQVVGRGDVLFESVMAQTYCWRPK